MWCVTIVHCIDNKVWCVTIVQCTEERQSVVNHLCIVYRVQAKCGVSPLYSIQSTDNVWSVTIVQCILLDYRQRVVCYHCTMYTIR